MTDASGRFSLAGVATGDRVLTFETQQASPAVAVPHVQPAEQINLAVSINGSSAQIDSMTRSSDSASGEVGDDPEDDPSQPPTSALTMSLSPSDWESCSEENNGNLQVFVRGTGYDQIDTNSLLLSGDDPAATPLAPYDASVQGSHLKATFKRADAFALLLAPFVDGEVRTLTLDYVDLNGAPGQLTADVTISACDDQGEDETGDETGDDSGDDSGGD